jgi:hypothetical protein
MHKFITQGLVLILFLGLSQVKSKAQVGIEELDPDTLSVLDLGSKDKGLLIPRLSTEQRIALSSKSSAEQNALLVFDTDLDAFFHLTNGEWYSLNGWESCTEENPTKNMFLDLRLAERVGILEDPLPEETLAVGGNTEVQGNIKAKEILINGDLMVIGNISTSGDINICTPGKGFSTPTYSSGGETGKLGPVPPGTVLPFDGVFDNFDNYGKGKPNTPVEGWAICNGSNNTPDLRNRFIVGVGSSYSFKSTGGEETVVLKPDEMPVHNHKVNETEHAHEFNGTAELTHSEVEHASITGSNGVSSWTNSTYSSPVKVKCSKTGNSVPHNNLPPYYALCFIMKL